VSIGRLKDIFNQVLIEGKCPENCRKSFIVPIFKGKDDKQECGNYKRNKADEL
jgi:hypothetical protein